MVSHATSRRHNVSVGNPAPFRHILARHFEITGMLCQRMHGLMQELQDLESDKHFGTVSVCQGYGWVKAMMLDTWCENVVNACRDVWRCLSIFEAFVSCREGEFPNDIYMSCWKGPFDTLHWMPSTSILLHAVCSVDLHFTFARRMPEHSPSRRESGGGWAIVQWEWDDYYSSQKKDNCVEHLFSVSSPSSHQFASTFS